MFFTDPRESRQTVGHLSFSPCDAPTPTPPTIRNPKQTKSVNMPAVPRQRTTYETAAAAAAAAIIVGNRCRNLDRQRYTIKRRSVATIAGPSDNVDRWRVLGTLKRQRSTALTPRVWTGTDRIDGCCVHGYIQTACAPRQRRTALRYTVVARILPSERCNHTRAASTTLSVD